MKIKIIKDYKNLKAGDVVNVDASYGEILKKKKVAKSEDSVEKAEDKPESTKADDAATSEATSEVTKKPFWNK